MHLTRFEVTPLVPVARKGTKYIARPMSHYTSSVSVLSAVRDMLKIARTAREVHTLIKQKALMINGRVVRDYHEPLHLFGLFDADKRYRLVITSAGRFSLEATTAKTRVAKVIGKTMLRGKMLQVNFHDGTNVLTKDKVEVGSSAELDLSNKVVRWIALGKGAHVFVRSGRSLGQSGKVKSIEGKSIHIELGGRVVVLDSDHVIAQ